MQVSPANGAIGQNIPITLTWTKVTGADMYCFQVSANSTFSTIAIADSMIMVDSAITNGLNLNTNYYWQVRAMSGVGISAWSNAWNFTTAVSLPE